MVQTEEFIFQNVAYRVTVNRKSRKDVYRTGTRSIVCKSGPGTFKVRVEWLDSLFPQTGHSNFLSISRS
jgi:hypothetical protein